MVGNYDLCVILIYLLTVGFRVGGGTSKLVYS